MADGGDSTRAAEAQRHFERAIALAPEDDSVHSFYARWLLRHGRTAEAAAQAGQAVMLNPARAFGHEVLIEAESAMGDVAATRAAAAGTLAAVPGDAVALQAMADPASAAVRPVGPPPSKADALVNVSLALAKQGKFAESIASAKEALALDPRSATAWNNIGAGYGSLGRWDQAIYAAQQAIQLDGTLQIAKNNLAWFTQQRKGRSTAQAGTAWPGTPTAADLLNQSWALAQEGKFEESKAAARGVLRLDPNSAEAWNNIAAADEAEHHWDEAIAAAQQAVGLKPEFQLARNNLAWSISQKQQGVH